MTNVESVRNQVAVTGLTGPSRRMILRNGLLVGTGVVAAGAMSVAYAGSAKAAAPPGDGPQGGWAWCSKCQGLYYVNSARNVCPYDAVFGKHGQAKSFQYFVFYNSEALYWQPGWAWCGACAGLFYANGAKSAGSCPDLDGYGPHINSGYNYTLLWGGASALGYASQPGWNYCKNCRGAFYGDEKENAGVCPLDNSTYLHAAGGYAYEMLH